MASCARLSGSLSFCVHVKLFFRIVSYRVVYCLLLFVHIGDKVEIVVITFDTINTAFQSKLCLTKSTIHDIHHIRAFAEQLDIPFRGLGSKITFDIIILCCVCDNNTLVSIMSLSSDHLSVSCVPVTECAERIPITSFRCLGQLGRTCDC